MIYPYQNQLHVVQDNITMEFTKRIPLAKSWRMCWVDITASNLHLYF